MRLAVSGNGYSSATNSFLEANYLTAILTRQLMIALVHTGAMAGHTAAGFAASYDQAACEGISTLVDLTDALANLGRMSQATARNHAHAEARAVVAHASVYDDPQPEPTYAHLAAHSPPSAAGSHSPALPHWEAWLLDHIEGFVWPDSETGRLRDAAHAWRTASHQLQTVNTYCLHAATALELEVAPDIELAADATRRLATHADSLAQTLHGLARSCDDLADQVEHNRDQVLDLVRDTLRDAMIVEGIGIVLGAVSGGITAAAASSANAARIAAIAPRIIRIIEDLRLAIGASQTGARLATTGVVETRTALQAFIKARVISASDRGAVRVPFGDAAKDVSQQWERAVPSTIDAKLGNYVTNLFKGVSRKDRIGDGTTMDAIRHERATGLPTQGKMHTIKGEETLRGLETWLRTRPDASPSDIAVARQLVSELKDALR